MTTFENQQLLHNQRHKQHIKTNSMRASVLLKPLEDLRRPVVPSIITPGVVLSFKAAKEEQSQVELFQKVFKTHNRITNFFTIRQKD